MGEQSRTLSVAAASARSSDSSFSRSTSYAGSEVHQNSATAVIDQVRARTSTSTQDKSEAQGQKCRRFDGCAQCTFRRKCVSYPHCRNSFALKTSDDMLREGWTA